MTTQLIPMRNDLDDYTYRIDIDSVAYILQFDFNARSVLYTLKVFDSERNFIAACPLVGGAALLNELKKENLPQGILFFEDTTGLDEEPASITDFSTRFRLLYVPEADL